MFGDLFGVFGLAGKGDRPTAVHCCVNQVYTVYCTLAATSWFLICTALCASTTNHYVTRRGWWVRCSRRPGLA